MSEREAPLGRRELFTLGWRKAAADAGARRSSRWIRPPHALPEPEFLAKCTGCGECIAACPHDVIFALAAGAGLRAETTPALDLLNRGCHMCEDMPCVAACETGALVLPEQADNAAPALPRLALVEIDTDTCWPTWGRNAAPAPMPAQCPGRFRGRVGSGRSSRQASAPDARSAAKPASSSPRRSRSAR